MAKIYSFEKFKIRQRIKEIENNIEERKKYGNANGFLWIDHFTIMSLHKEILELNNDLKKIENETSNGENKKN